MTDGSTEPPADRRPHAGAAPPPGRTAYTFAADDGGKVHLVEYPHRPRDGGFSVSECGRVVDQTVPPGTPIPVAVWCPACRELPGWATAGEAAGGGEG